MTKQECFLFGFPGSLISLFCFILTGWVFYGCSITNKVIFFLFKLKFMDCSGCSTLFVMKLNGKIPTLPPPPFLVCVSVNNCGSGVSNSRFPIIYLFPPPFSVSLKMTFCVTLVCKTCLTFEKF